MGKHENNNLRLMGEVIVIFYMNSYKTYDFLFMYE